MDNSELVRSWKDPKARQSGSAAHPSGSITLASAGALGRRAGLLTAVAANGRRNTVGDLPTYTYTIEL